MSRLLGPQQAILVTARAEMEYFGKHIIKDDVEASFWHTALSADEKQYGVTLHSKSHVAALIRKSNIFVVNFLPYGLEKQTHTCAKMHGQHIDKFEQTGLVKGEAPSIDCCTIKEACALLECELVQEIPAGENSFFIAKIINSTLLAKTKRLFHIADNHYTTTDEV